MLDGCTVAHGEGLEKDMDWKARGERQQLI